MGPQELTVSSAPESSEILPGEQMGVTGPSHPVTFHQRLTLPGPIAPGQTQMRSTKQVLGSFSKLPLSMPSQAKTPETQLSKLATACGTRVEAEGRLHEKQLGRTWEGSVLLLELWEGPGGVEFTLGWMHPGRVTVWWGTLMVLT